MQSSRTKSTQPEEKMISTIKVYAGQVKTQLLKQELGNSRFVWNKLLEKNKELYEKGKKFLF